MNLYVNSIERIKYHNCLPKERKKRKEKTHEHVQYHKAKRAMEDV